MPTLGGNYRLFHPLFASWDASLPSFEKKWSSQFMPFSSHMSSFVSISRKEDKLVALIVYSPFRRVVTISFWNNSIASSIRAVDWSRLGSNEEWIRSLSVVNTALQYGIVMLLGWKWRHQTGSDGTLTEQIFSLRVDYTAIQSIHFQLNFDLKHCCKLHWLQTIKLSTLKRWIYL